MDHSRHQQIPQIFCWTRFGTEAGQPIERILERKEAERRANGGVFLWGIGNSVAPGIAELIRRSNRPEVLFSPIKSRPRSADVKPANVASWTVGETVAGSQFELPRTVSILSRCADQTRCAPHYALICSLDEPLVLSDLGRLTFHALRNVISGSPLGASQVTAVVRQVDMRDGERGDYMIAFRAQLVAPYFIRLREPVAVDGSAERGDRPKGHYSTFRLSL
jgi:hypothetical protein